MTERRVQEAVINILGEPRFTNKIPVTMDDRVRLPENIVSINGEPIKRGFSFELAGPREKLFFDPSVTRAGIVTCGGLCPGLNNVIRSIFLELYYLYGVKDVLGFKCGYKGLDPASGLEPIALTPDIVDKIHREGGTILGTSRGPVDPGVALDNLSKRGINILFVVGGDGTQRGGNELYLEAKKRNYPLSVVGVPKTIDNDVSFVSRTFGYLTAVEEAAKIIACAHMEAHSVSNGISIVKVMGRDSGFIAAGATVASQDVNFTLIPEVPFKLDGEKGFLNVLKKRVLSRAHAVIVVAEGAGQELFDQTSVTRDESGNVKLKDIGLLLKEKIESYFKNEKVPVTIRYFDPSYLLRSVPADAEDSILCDLFARSAVHAAMAGKTGLVIGLMHDMFIHVPIELLTARKKHIDRNGMIWRAVLAATGQPALFE
jgi:6-phosphofructokinase 1